MDMKRFMIVLSIAFLIFVFILIETQSAMITYNVFDYGDGIWEYYYWISDFNFYQNSGLTVYFDYGHYHNILPVSKGSDWDVFTYDPQLIMGYEDPGVYDAWAQVDNASLGEPFIVKFNWLGVGNPGLQRFDIYDSNLETLEKESGWTEPNLPLSLMTIHMDLPEGWSMISLPVIPFDAKIKTLFPGVRAIFKFTKRYKRLNPDDEMVAGKGYWIHLRDERTFPVTGTPFEVIEIDVPSGWSMIGGCSYSTMLSMEDGTIRAVFGFSNKYDHLGTEDALQPGKGYWVYLPKAATIILGKKS